ncbi:MAG: hypothetical protein V3T31_05140, partial [candidate division Zixibacteria bacterium]
SYAYWSQAGLETAAFALLTALALYCFLRHHYLLMAVLTIAVLIRPEGALLAAILIAVEAIVYRRLPRYSLRCAAGALLMLLPMVLFRYLYYGSLLPNTFYAKASFDYEQLLAGFEYLTRFFSHYSFFAIGHVLPLFLWRKLTKPARALWLFTLMYIVYIVLIGGDVLKVHRFFLPLLAPMSILVVVSINGLTRRLAARWRYVLLVILGFAMLVATHLIPQKFIDHYAYMERGMVSKFQSLGRRMSEADSSNFSVALSTIGVFSYEVIGHRVIDMLGLTDSTIARHPEEPIAGMETTWKERRYNSHYLLESAPDYVVFATGRRPSSPAERSLMLYQQFLSAYRTVVFLYKPTSSTTERQLITAFKRVRPIKLPIERTHAIQFVEAYIEGVWATVRGEYVISQKHFIQAKRLDTSPPYSLLVYKMARNLFGQKRQAEGERLLNELIKVDSFVYEAHSDLYTYELAVGDRDKAAIHRRWLYRLIPWIAGSFDSLAIATARQFSR